MIKKTISILIILILSISLMGCLTYSQPTQPTQSTQQIEQNKVENNQKTLLTNQPIPTIQKSLERENLINRMKVLNTENKVFYVYLISYGKVMAFYTAKGKVSSLNSYLNSQQRIVGSTECFHKTSYDGAGGCFQVIDTPDIDGSYGENADGVFFFTTEGAYVEWKGEYMASDYPLKLTTPPELVMNIEK